jgi:hypothetical protein
MEGCRSGLTGLSRKQCMGKLIREFESHPLRHEKRQRPKVIVFFHNLIEIKAMRLSHPLRQRKFFDILSKNFYFFA